MCNCSTKKSKKNLSEALKHFFFAPLHEWAAEWTVLLELDSHSFIYTVDDCPFLAKKIQFLSFYSYFKSVVSALSCVTKKMILLWMVLTETPVTKPHLRAKFPFYSQRWSGSKHQESKAKRETWTPGVSFLWTNKDIIDSLVPVWPF